VRGVASSNDEGFIRDLNDTCNRLLREKRAWEYRIKELGGPDYTRGGTKMFDPLARELPGLRGYRYFGKARELPGVKELFEALVEDKEDKEDNDPRNKFADLYRRCDADYFGYRDEDDGTLLAFEAAKENECMPHYVRVTRGRATRVEAALSRRVSRASGRYGGDSSVHQARSRQHSLTKRDGRVPPQPEKTRAH
jgi:pre-mRNA-splicing factor ISY1